MKSCNDKKKIQNILNIKSENREMMKDRKTEGMITTEMIKKNNKKIKQVANSQNSKNYCNSIQKNLQKHDDYRIVSSTNSFYSVTNSELFFDAKSIQNISKNKIENQVSSPFLTEQPNQLKISILPSTLPQSSLHSGSCYLESPNNFYLSTCPQSLVNEFQQVPHQFSTSHFEPTSSQIRPVYNLQAISNVKKFYAVPSLNFESPESTFCHHPKSENLYNIQPKHQVHVPTNIYSKMLANETNSGISKTKKNHLQPLKFSLVNVKSQIQTPNLTCEQQHVNSPLPYAPAVNVYIKPSNTSPQKSENQMEANTQKNQKIIIEKQQEKQEVQQQNQSDYYLKADKKLKELFGSPFGVETHNNYLVKVSEKFDAILEELELLRIHKKRLEENKIIKEKCEDELKSRLFNEKTKNNNLNSSKFQRELEEQLVTDQKFKNEAKSVVNISNIAHKNYYDLIIKYKKQENEFNVYVKKHKTLLNKLTKENENLEEKIRDLNAKYEAVLDELRLTKQKSIEYGKKNVILLKLLEEKTNNDEITENEISALKQDINVQINKNFTINTKLCEKEKMVTKLKEELKKINDKMLIFQKENTKMLKEKNMLKEKIEFFFYLRNFLSSSKEEIIVKSKPFLMLQKKLKELVNQKNQAELDLSKVNSDKQKMHENLSDVNAKLIETKKELKSKIEENENLKAEIENYKHLTEKESAISMLQEEVDKLKTSYKDIKDQNKTFDKIFREKDKECNVLKTQLEELNKNMEDMVEKIKDDHGIELQSKKFNELLKEIEIIKTKCELYKSKMQQIEYHLYKRDNLLKLLEETKRKENTFNKSLSKEQNSMNKSDLYDVKKFETIVPNLNNTNKTKKDKCSWLNNSCLKERNRNSSLRNIDNAVIQQESKNYQKNYSDIPCVCVKNDENKNEIIQISNSNQRNSMDVSLQCLEVVDKHMNQYEQCKSVYKEELKNQKCKNFNIKNNDCVSEQKRKIQTDFRFNFLSDEIHYQNPKINEEMQLETGNSASQYNNFNINNGNTTINCYTADSNLKNSNLCYDNCDTLN